MPNKIWPGNFKILPNKDFFLEHFVCLFRWRFESLKSRCILIDRENLLTQNKINFKPVHAVEYNISEQSQKEAKPRIVANRRSSILESLNNRKSTSPSRSQQIVSKDDAILNDLHIKKELTNEVAAQEDIPTDYKNENQKLEPQFEAPENIDKFKAEIQSPHIKNIKTCDSFSMSIILDQFKEDKENSVICLDDTPILDNFASLRAKLPSPPSPMRPSQNLMEQKSLETNVTPVRSILTKNDLLVNSSKHVNFSADGDTVYNLSLHSSDSSSTAAAIDSETATHSKDTKNSGKISRTKSNIVVRRVVVNSKH